MAASGNAAAMKDSSMSILLIERDSSGDDLCVWTYPGASPSIQNVCVHRVSTEGQVQPFLYFKLRQDWIYTYTQSLSPKDRDGIPDVVAASVCIVSRQFNPEIYETLARVLFEQYRTSSGDPTKILEAYLAIYTLGSFSNSAGSVELAACKSTNTQTSNAMLFRELFELLGVEFIVLWNALLLKKRVLVVGENLSGLQDTMLSLAQLVWHRKDECLLSFLRPLVRGDPSGEHVEDLTSAGVYVAGTLDTSLASRSELYDVLLSLPERRVTVTNHALADMKMCSVHRELAGSLQELVATDPQVSDFDLLKVIAKKASTVLSQLRSIAAGAPGGKLSEALINETVTQAAAQQWLVRLAQSEGML